MSERRRTIKLRQVGELLDLAYPPTLVKRLLGANALSCWYGPPGSRKTFLLLDLAFHVALGLDWCRRRVEQGPVVYVLMEGVHTARARAQAWAKHHGVDLASVPLYFADPVTLGVKTTNGADDSVALARAIEERASGAVLTVIDTVNRAMNGDENNTRDMSAFVRAADIVRNETGAHVSVVHHTGKDASRGARGSTALLGAVDTEVSVDLVDGLTVARVTKQRDFEPDAKLVFEASPQIEVGQDEDGESITSIVLVPSDREPTGAGDTGDDKALRSLRAVLARQRNRNAGRIAGVEDHWFITTVDDWRRQCVEDKIGRSADASRKAMKRAQQKLTQEGTIILSADGEFVTAEWSGEGGPRVGDQYEAPF